MFTDSQIPQECLQLWKDCCSQVSSLVSDIPVKNSDLCIPADTEIDCHHSQSIYLIKEGILKETLDHNVLINHEAGDLVGLDTIAQKKPTRLKTEFAIIVDEYDSGLFLNNIYRDPVRTLALIRFLSSLYHSYQLIACYYNQEVTEFNPEIRQYNKDEIIIEEKATDNEVFTLLSGTADAYVSNTRVGEIKTDEIFGAITALTGTPRTARVIATSDCTVLVVPSENFQDLLKTRPGTVNKLIEDMARTIAASNQKIVELSSK
ncbi:MAG: cyclic nucleotide-binding domain-containing protein [Gammaproteobacteria bacterium]|nr:cyclic nucleotide-binding domain-containing protein [Gammaproteobacteria bacterium]